MVTSPAKDRDVAFNCEVLVAPPMLSVVLVTETAPAVPERLTVPAVAVTAPTVPVLVNTPPVWVIAPSVPLFDTLLPLLSVTTPAVPVFVNVPLVVIPRAVTPAFESVPAFVMRPVCVSVTEEPIVSADPLAVETVPL